MTNACHDRDNGAGRVRATNDRPNAPHGAGHLSYAAHEIMIFHAHRATEKDSTSHRLERESC
jgi:hypothetical protein